METYRANDASVLGRLIDYFRRNDDEELTCMDAWTKLDGPSLRAVQDALRDGAKAGWFDVEGNARGGAGARLLYRAGPRLRPRVTPGQGMTA